MSALVIAIGNPLRRDDGAAHYVANLLPSNIQRRSELQLMPELAAEIAPYENVVFVDADIQSKQLRIEPVSLCSSASPFTHVLRPPELVALARSLFGFSGEAYLCRIPARDLSEGSGLTPLAQQSARQAAPEIEALLIKPAAALHRNRRGPGSRPGSPREAEQHPRLRA